MLSSQVRVGVIRDRNLHHQTTEHHLTTPIKSTSNLLTRLQNPQCPTTRYKALEEIENLLRHPNNALANIISQPDVCVLALLNYAQLDETPRQYKCKSRLILAYFLDGNNVFPQLKPDTVQSVVQDTLLCLRSLNETLQSQDNVLLPCLFMLISKFEFEKTIVTADVWKELVFLVVETVCQRPSLHNYIGGTDIPNETPLPMLQHLIFEYVNALKQLLKIVPADIMKITAPKFVVHLCYCSLKTSHVTLVPAAIVTLDQMIKCIYPVSTAITKALSVEMGEITKSGTPLISFKNDTTNLLTILVSKYKSERERCIAYMESTVD